VKVILDANILVSLKTARKASPIQELRQLWLIKNAFQVAMSDYIHEEVVRTLYKPYFLSKLDHDARIEYLWRLRKITTRVEVTTTVVEAAAHPKDDPIVATAIDAHLKHIITGDKPFQRKAPHIFETYEISVLTPEAFIDEEKDFRGFSVLLYAHHSSLSLCGRACQVLLRPRYLLYEVTVRGLRNAE